MARRSLIEWLRWQETLNPAEIELGLERVAEVAGRMAWPAPRFFLFTVGGTNGKGSAVALLEASLGVAGYRTGAYTSPHLLRYNERVRVGGEEVSDETLCRAFERVDHARGQVPLTYFEFGTLAAMDVFHEAGCEAVILEVGLGGRLDAVNLFDADVALVMSVAIDHTDWLGPDREAIGREKAGIFRPGRPAVCGDPEPPESLRRVARGLGAKLYVAGQDYQFAPDGGGWRWQHGERTLANLPRPLLAGAFQLRNAATVLMALSLAEDRLPVPDEAIRAGLRRASLAGRLQVLEGPVQRILDVAHNPEAVRELAGFLGGRPCDGRTHAVLAMLADKDIHGVVGELESRVDRWHVAGLESPRGWGARRLADAVRAVVPNGDLRVYPDVPAAYRGALAEADPGDRVVVCGSFQTVGPVLRLETCRGRPDTVADG